MCTNLRFEIRGACGLAVLLALSTCTRDDGPTEPADAVRSCIAAASRCVAQIRVGYPDTWSVERVLEQRVLRDGWNATPFCSDLSALFARTRQLVGETNPLLRFNVPPALALDEERDTVVWAGDRFRRIDGALQSLALEFGLAPVPLPLEGSLPPPLPKWVELPRWRDAAQQYRTQAWPYADGVVVLETVRTQPGQPGCPAGSTSQCDTAAATWINWTGEPSERIILPATADTTWWKWDASADGALLALGFRAKRTPTVVSFARGGKSTRRARLPDDAKGLRAIEALRDAVLLEGEPDSYFASLSQLQFRARSAEDSLERLFRRQWSFGDDPAGPDPIRFADTSALTFEKRGRALVARRLAADSTTTGVERIAELYGELGHLNYVAADPQGRLAVVFTHPSAKVTSLLISNDGGASWISGDR